MTLEARDLIRGGAQDIGLQGCHVAICTSCLDGAGGECHTPGCLFWMCSAPDIPIRERAEDSDGHHIALALDAAREEGRREALAATCLRPWYHHSAQEDRVCRLPRGHAPEEHGCAGEPADEGDDG